MLNGESDKSFVDDLVASGYCKHERYLCISRCWGLSLVSMICSSLISKLYFRIPKIKNFFGFRKFKISLPQKFVLSQEELLFGPCPNATVLTGLVCFSDHAPTVIEVGNVGYSSHSRFCQCVPKNASFQKCGPNSRKMLLFRGVGLCKCFCFENSNFFFDWFMCCGDLRDHPIPTLSP